MAPCFFPVPEGTGANTRIGSCPHNGTVCQVVGDARGRFWLCRAPAAAGPTFPRARRVCCSCIDMTLCSLPLD